MIFTNFLYVEHYIQTPRQLRIIIVFFGDVLGPFDPCFNRYIHVIIYGLANSKFSGSLATFVTSSL